MRARRLAAAAAATLLLVLFLLQNRPAELRQRVAFLRHSASQDLALRRLAGSGAAFDRRYFAFLESVRRKVPPGTRGVAVFRDPPTTAALYLASYALAPIPVVLAPRRVPPRWLAAVYGETVPAGWRVLATVAGGALLDPP
ncbi:MAG: hypothetical protein ABJC28_00455 [Acidobacteriota bacterium]